MFDSPTHERWIDILSAYTYIYVYWINMYTCWTSISHIFYYCSISSASLLTNKRVLHLTNAQWGSVVASDLFCYSFRGNFIVFYRYPWHMAAYHRIASILSSPLTTALTTPFKPSRVTQQFFLSHSDLPQAVSSSFWYPRTSYIHCLGRGTIWTCV